MRSAATTLLVTLLVTGCASIEPAGRAADVVAVPAAFPESASRVDAAKACYDLGMPELPGLVTTLDERSYNLRAAAARLARADALARQASSGLWPQLAAALGGTRGSSAAARAGIDVPGLPDIENQFTGSLAASYEADVWGRVRDGAGNERASRNSSVL